MTGFYPLSVIFYLNYSYTSHFPHTHTIRGSGLFLTFLMNALRGLWIMKTLAVGFYAMMMADSAYNILP